MNQKDLFILGENTLKKFNVDDAHIKAKILLEFVLKQNDSELLKNESEEVDYLKKQQYEENLKEIINGKPLQYITNSQEFMGLNFFVNEKVLIPQPDTEILVETAIKTIEKCTVNSKCESIRKKSIKEYNTENKQVEILDLCTGSGCIGISIAKYSANTKVTASDISKEVIQVAKKNAILNNVQEKIKFIVSNLFENIKNKKFEIIVSNPPYIEKSTIKTLSREVQNEPMLALNGGEDGLYFYKKILKSAYNYLMPNGYLILEIGYNQAEKIINIYKQLTKSANKENQKLILETKNAIKDLTGNDRVLIFKNKN